MSHRRIDRKGVLLVTLGGGVVAGVLMLLHDVLVLGYRGGFVPVWLGVLITLTLSSAAAMASIGSAYVVFVLIERCVSMRSIRPFAVVVSACTAALVGGAAGLRFAHGSDNDFFAIAWSLAPALLVGVLFPRLRSRYVLDGSDRMEAALDRARARWPEDSDEPTRLLQRLIELGDARLTESVDERALQRRSAIARTSGAVPGLYPKGHLEQLRSDWPD